MIIIPFEKSFASHEKSKFWSSKNEKVPSEVFKSSHMKFWFDCPDCNHSFDTRLGSVVCGGNWCSYCSNKKLCDDNNCDFCHSKSFASHEKAKFWSSKNEKVTREVFKSTATKYWFDCPDCNHPFDAPLDAITKGCWCPFCSNKKLCDDKNCDFCHSKSFASHEKAKFWSNKNEKVPREVFKQYHKKCWFDCPDCNHDFVSSLNNIVYGNWCSFCSSKQLCDENNCESCHSKSFASHEKSKFWSNKNEKVPREVFKSTATKYWFDCPCNHDFDAALCHISNGKWCPTCKNKTELKLFTILKPIYPSLIKQFKQEWCRKKLCLPFDFCIPELKIIIELDGLQHFKQVSNWSSPEEQFENDKYKQKCANTNGYSVIRILQEDVFKDTYDWCKELCIAIEEIKNGVELSNKYLCTNGEYEQYQQLNV